MRSMDEARPQSDLVNFCIVTQIGGVFINARLVLPVLRDALLLFAGVFCGDAARTCAITWRAFCLRAGRGRLGEVGRLVAAQEPMASCPAALKRIHLRMLWHQSKYTGRTAPGHGFWVLLPLGEGSVLLLNGPLA